MPDTAFWVSYGILWLVVALLCLFMLATLRPLGLLFEAVDPILRFNRHRLRVKIDDPPPGVPLGTTPEQPVELTVPAGSFGLVLVVQRNCAAYAADDLCAAERTTARRHHGDREAQLLCEAQEVGVGVCGSDGIALGSYRAPFPPPRCLMSPSRAPASIWAFGRRCPPPCGRAEGSSHLRLPGR